MAFAVLVLISALLLFVPVDLIALQGSDFLSIKFIINCVTHIMGHGSFQHFFGNYFAMAPFFLFLDRLIGWKKAVSIFFATAFTGTLGFIAWNGGVGWGLIGSSGGVFGIIGCALVMYSRTPLKALLALGAFVVLMDHQITAMLYDMFSGVANAAHIFGALAGASIGVAMLCWPKKRKKSKKKSARGIRQ